MKGDLRIVKSSCYLTHRRYLVGSFLTLVKLYPIMSELQPELAKLAISDSPVASLPLSKRILTKAHLEAFQVSTTHQEIIELVEDLNKAIVGVKLGQDGEKSAVSPVTPLTA